LMRAYHDEEWGVPERDSRALWESLMLDGFQAGLSWLTILRKREAFRKAFRNFDPKKVFLSHRGSLPFGDGIWKRKRVRRKAVGDPSTPRTPFGMTAFLGAGA